jgi:hypothetical protein
MTHEQFNEHDANQGAQSRGEFLGMSGNSAWYLLGSAGASVLLVIVLWGMLGLSLVLCLALGAILCALSVVYVFALKNNRPEHYDTDFFESALVEAGVLSLAFGPGDKRPPNPFRAASIATEPVSTVNGKRVVAGTRVSRPVVGSGSSADVREEVAVENTEQKVDRRKKQEEPTVPLSDYERLRNEVTASEEALADALASGEEDVCM